MFSDEDVPVASPGPDSPFCGQVSRSFTAPQGRAADLSPAAGQGADQTALVAPAVHAKIVQAAKAREGKAIRAALREVAGRPPRSQPWARAEHERAAHALFHEPLLVSTRAAARQLKVDNRFFTRLIITTASLILEAELEAFRGLLAELEAASAAGRVRPVMFTLCRMYDETPTRAWTHDVLPSGGLSGEAAVAKIMASIMSFAMVLQVAAGTSPEPARLERQGSLADSQAAAERQRFHVLRGSLSTRLAAMASQTKEVVYDTIKATMSIPEAERKRVEALFPRTCTLRMTDLHRSSMPAERHLAGKLKRWPSALFRCSMHRARTSERLVIELDKRTESFFLNYTLSLRQPNAQSALQARILEWVEKHLKIMEGPPPDEVLTWRRSIEPWLFAAADSADSRVDGRPPTQAALARRYCWDVLTNGDGRVHNEFQHYCSKVCCPGGREETLAKLLGPLGVRALLQPPPPIFPRRSWHGQCECMAHVIQLEATHGLLSQNFRTIEVVARQRATKALARLAAQAAAGGPVGEAGLADSQAADHGNHVAVGEAMRAASLAEQAAETCRDALNFLVCADRHQPLRDMLRLRILLQPHRVLKSSILHRTGAPWQNEQMVGATLPESRPPEFPVTLAHSGQDVHTALEAIGLQLGFGADSPWACFSHLPRLPSDGSLRWRCLSRGGAALTQLLLCEQSVYPWKLFSILDPQAAKAAQAAEEICADASRCPRLMDPLAADHWRRFPSTDALLSADSIMSLLTMATCIADNTSAVERGHASNKRTDRARSQTHSTRLMDSSAERIVRRIKLAAADWQGRAAAAQRDSLNAAGLADSQAGAPEPARPARARRPRRQQGRVSRRQTARGLE